MAGSVRTHRWFSHPAHSQHRAECTGRPHVLHGVTQWRNPEHRRLEALEDFEYAGFSLYLAAFHWLVCRLLYSRDLLAYARVSAPLLPDLCVRALSLLLRTRQWRATDGLAADQSQHARDLRLCLWHGADVCVTPGRKPRSAGLCEPVLWHGQLPVSAAPGEPGTVYFAAGQGAAFSHHRRTDVILGSLDYAILVRAGWRHSVGWPASAQPLALLRGPGAPPARGGQICFLRLWGSFCVPPGDI